MTGAVENLKVFHRGRMRLKACLLAVMSGLAGAETYGDPGVTVGSRRHALRSMDVGNKVIGRGGVMLFVVYVLQSVCAYFMEVGLHFFSRWDL